MRNLKLKKAPGFYPVDVIKGVTNIIVEEIGNEDMVVAFLPSGRESEALKMAAAPDLYNFAKQFTEVAGVLMLLSDKLDGDQKDSYEKILAALSLLATDALLKTKR